MLSGQNEPKLVRSLFICQALCRFLFLMLNISFCFLSLLPPQILPLSLTHILSFAVHILGFTCLGKVLRKNARNDRRIRWNKVQVGSRFPLEFQFNYTSCVFHFSPTCLADSWSYRHDLNNLPPAHLS